MKKVRYLSRFELELLTRIGKFYRHTYKEGGIEISGKPNSRQKRRLNELIFNKNGNK